MAAANTDKFRKVARKWTGQVGSGGVADDTATTVPLASATNLPTDTAVMITIDRVDANGTKTPTKEEGIIGVVSGSNLIDCIRGVEGTAQAHGAGAVVEVLNTAANINDMLDTFLTEHAQDGTHKMLTSPQLTTPKITTSINDANGNEVIKTPATTSAVNEITITNAATGGTVLISATGGDTNIGLDLKAKGTGVVRKPCTIAAQVIPGDTDVETGDGKLYIPIPEELNGMNLVRVWAGVITAGTTNVTSIQIHNETDNTDMLSTNITIDSGETGSHTAATAAVIDTTKDDVATNDVLRVDCDGVSTTKPRGLIIRLAFALP